jgi:hypothetical protein
MIKSERLFFNHSIPSYELSIKFNDSKHVAQSSLFNISYEIRLHDTCGNRFNKIIKLNEIFRKTGIPSGDYFLEIIPKVETIFCKDQCPVFVNKNGLFENEVQCEDCRKMIKFIQIKNNKDNKNFQCFKEVDKSFEVFADEMFFMKFSIEHEENSVIAKSNQTITVPLLLDSNQLCSRKLIIIFPEDRFNFFIIFSIGSFISLTVLSIVFSIILLFGYGKLQKFFLNLRVKC